MNDKNAPPAPRVQAAQALLDRGWGKPSQTLEIKDITEVGELTDDELIGVVVAGRSGRRAAKKANGKERLPNVH